MRVLSIIEAAYRATLEEQDDPVIWITHAMRGAGAEIDVLLRGNAVNYAIRQQDASGLAFGGLEQTQPPQLPGDLVKLAAKGAKIYAVDDALRSRGISKSDAIDTLQVLPKDALAALLDGYDQVWHW